MFRALRDKIKRFDFAINVATAALAIYLAVGNILRGVKIPSEAFWLPWKAPFIVLIVAAIYVPIYGFYKALDARYESLDREVNERQRDLGIHCQQGAAALLGQCPETELNELAVQVWRCRDDETFDRRARFFLPHYHKSSGVEWRKGKGVAGAAWAQGKPVMVDLAPLYERAKVGEQAFNALPADERLGMTHQEVQASSDSRGVAAYPLFSTESSRTLLGIFLIEYTSEDGSFECLTKALKTWWHLGALLAACENVLTAEAQVS